MIDLILQFWFGDCRDDAVDPVAQKRWYSGGESLDREIRERFGDALLRISRGELDDWQASARGRLAGVILLDQFSRNIHRGSAEAFACDPLARQWVKAGLAEGEHFKLSVIERSFFYMPLEHSELLADQLQCVSLFEELLAEAPVSLQPYVQSALDYARHHADIIERFNRFPHRNQALARAPTECEQQYLEEGGARFGQ